MAKRSAVEEVEEVEEVEVEEEAGEEVEALETDQTMDVPMPDGFIVWDTYLFNVNDIVIDHTQNGRRFGVRQEKVRALREDFLNPSIGQLQECGVYWNSSIAAFQLGLGYHRAAAALSITVDGVGPDDDGAFLLRCVVLPTSGVIDSMGVNLAESSPRTRTELSPMDKAYIIDRMLENGYTQKDIAIRMGYSRAIVSQAKHLTSFPLKVQKAIDQGKITQAAAFDLVEFKDTPDILQAKVDEMLSRDGNVGTAAVRASRRGGEDDEDGGGEETEAEVQAPEPKGKTGRTLKEVMGFRRDFSDCEKDTEPLPSQTVLKIVLKFAEGKIKEKAAVNAINKACGYEAPKQ